MSSRSRFLATFVFLAATAGSSPALAASWHGAGGCANFIGSGWMLGCDGPGRSGTAFYWNGSSWSRRSLWGAPSVFWNMSVDLTGQAWLVSEDQHVYKAIGSKESGYVLIPFGPSSFTAFAVASGSSDGETYALSDVPSNSNCLSRYDPSTQSWIDMTSLVGSPTAFWNLSVWSETSCAGHTVVLEDNLSDLATISGVAVHNRYESSCLRVVGGLPRQPDGLDGYLSSDMIQTLEQTPQGPYGNLWWWNDTRWTLVVKAGNLFIAAASPENGIWAIDDNHHPFVWR
jgi:hypothetical protein